MFTVFSRPVFRLFNTIKSCAYLKPPRHDKHSGFTLLELLVVITLLSIVASAVVIGYEDVQEQGREDMARFEMAEIRKALLQFRRDSGTRDFPGQGIYDCGSTNMETIAKSNDPPGVETWPSGAPSADSDISAWQAWCAHPANFWMLFIDPLGNGWNKDTKRGWNGPYLQRKSGFLDIGDNLLPDASGSPIQGAPIQNVWGIADPNIEKFVIEADGDEHLVWRSTISQAEPHDKYGRPYFLFGMNTDAADETDDDRIVSMSTDGKYDGIGTEPCIPPLNPNTSEALDLVLCLLR